ncbi:MAG: hypothetical protein R2865_14205 [Deinococcales bacterium]
MVLLVPLVTAVVLLVAVGTHGSLRSSWHLLVSGPAGEVVEIIKEPVRDPNCGTITPVTTTPACGSVEAHPYIGLGAFSET